jgi:hypothetical protein
MPLRCSRPSEHREKHLVLPGGSGDGDAPIGLGLREVQLLRTVREHRGKRLAGVEPSLVDLADVGDEVGLDPTRLRHQLVEAEQQLVVGHGVKRA